MNQVVNEPSNILVVSDLHFGEELLPGASLERRRAVEIGATAFREFVRHHAIRRRDGRPWRLVIAGDLFDFMSVVVPGLPARPARTADERQFGLPRGVAAGVERMRRIAEAHPGLLADLARFAGAGHRVDLVVGNHDVELLAPEVEAELRRHLRLAGASDAALGRIAVVPWFVHVPGVCWIEHGHVYDEGCSFEFNLAPFDPGDGELVPNADTAAIRYLGSAAPDLDPHGTEAWSFWGYLQYGWGKGARHVAALLAGYGRFLRALLAARAMHRSFKRRDRRRREHRARLAAAAATGGLTVDAASAVDRLARAPMTVSARRIGRMLMLDRFGLGLAAAVLVIALLALAPLGWALAGAALVVGAALGALRWLGAHLVLSQLPMRAVPARIRRIVDVPLVVFGHTHDPRWQRLRGGGLYVNSGTWLPATRPGLRRSFTHVFIAAPLAPGAAPVVELRQWHEGRAVAFDAHADLGAGGMTRPGVPLDAADAPGGALDRAGEGAAAPGGPAF